MAVAAAENGKHSIAFASGMAATSAILHLLKSGDRIIAMDDMYGGTHRYMIKTAAPTYGMEFEFVDMTDPANLEAALKATPAKLVWVETPTNPTLKISDIEALAKITHAHGAILAVDNTFMSPHFQKPLDLGADLSMSSVTKYINGHSDVVMGVVTTRSDELDEKLRFVQNGVGAVAGPHAAYLALRGLKTLHVRMDRHASNAMAVSKLLEKHPFVKKVVYPGLESHPQHELAKKQMSGFGGMVTFYIEGGLEGAQHFLEQLKVFVLAESLGAVESLAECPAIMTHASVPPAHRAKLGLTDDLIRLSVGIETESDLLGDVQGALDKAQEYTGKVPTKAAAAAAEAAAAGEGK